MMLQGRTIVVTGAARGLGRQIALACGRAGARLVLGDLDEQGCMAACDEIAADGVEVRAMGVDLSDPGSIRAFADDIARTEQRVDGLVNNAAIATGIGGVAFDEIEIESWDRVMRVNVRGTWLMVRALAPMLSASGSGRIVNVASDTALWGAPKLLSYVSSKGAVMAMTRSLARELGPEKIGIAAVAPGILTTQSTDYVPQARHDLYSNGRAVPGPQNADDVAGTVCFLLTEPALALTGQTLPVNAGFVFN